MVPLVPFPASAVIDRLYPVMATSLLDTPGRAAAKSEPVLDAVETLLREHAPELLEAHWSVEGASSTRGYVSPAATTSTKDRAGRRQLPPRLVNVLNLQSLTMMYDLILSSGLVLTAIRTFPGGSEMVRIVVQGLRDPHNRGHEYLESITGNTVRYATRLGIEKETWSTEMSGGLGSGSAQTGQPAAQNVTTPAGAGERLVRPACRVVPRGSCQSGWQHHPGHHGWRL